jgi:hypothetical protein
MEIGDKIMYLYKGMNEWEGSNKELFSARTTGERIHLCLRIFTGCEGHPHAGSRRQNEEGSAVKEAQKLIDENESTS